MKKNYFVLAIIAVMMMFVGCDTEGSDSKDDEQSSAAPQQPQQPQQPQPQQPQPETVTYTFNANGGKWSDDTTANKTFSGTVGDTFTKPTNPTRTGYSFSNWDKAVPSVFDGSDDTFTAQWTVNTYTIVFNANGGEGEMSSMDMTYDVSADLPANAFTKDGCLFVGWATSADGEVVYTDGQEVKDLTADNEAEVILYAIWKVKIGAIMYSDMTFSSEYVAGKTPIGIVFEVGTKVKIVHLSEQSSLKWCLDTADGYNSNLATSTSDGSGNWQIICDAVSDETTDGNYPAFEYVNGLGSGWYLPAKDELNAVYTNKTAINAALTKLINAEVSATLLGRKGWYWSSSLSTYDAWGQSFSDGDQDYGDKYHLQFSVRAVRAF